MIELFKNKVDRTYLLLAILYSLLVRHIWFSNFNILARGDWQYQYLDIVKAQLYPSTWDAGGIGGVSTSVFTAPFQFLFGVFAHIGLGFEYSSRFLFFWPIAILTPIAIYQLARTVGLKPIAAFISTFIYGYNIFYLLYTNGALTLAFSSVLLTFAFNYFIEFLQTSNNLKLIISTFCVLACGVYDIRYVYILFFLEVFYFCYFQLLNLQSIKNIGKLLIPIAINWIIYILLNLYWVLPTIFSNNIAGNTAVRNTLFGNDFLNLQYALTLFHPFWTGSGVTVFQTNPIIPFYWIVPFLAFLSFYVYRRNKKLLFFALLMTLGILLTKQVDSPFPSLYEFLFNHFPGFKVFREASKFFVLISIPYSILIASLISIEFKNIFYNKLFKTFIATIVLIYSVLSSYPIVSGNLNQLDRPRFINQDYTNLRSILEQDKENSRTLFIPGSNYLGYQNENHTNVGLGKLYGTLFDPGLLSPLPTSKTPTETNYEFLNSSSFNYAISLFTIKYIVVPSIDLNVDSNNFEEKYYSIKYDKTSEQIRDGYIDILNKNNNLQKLNEFKDIVVYKNTNYLQEFQTSQNIENLSLNYDLDFILNNKIITNGEFFSKVNPEEKSSFLPFYNKNYDITSGKLFFNFKQAGDFVLKNNEEIIYSVKKDSDLKIMKSPISKFLKYNDISLSQDSDLLFEYKNSFNQKVLFNGVIIPQKNLDVFFRKMKKGDTIEVLDQDKNLTLFKYSFNEKTYPDIQLKNVNIDDSIEFENTKFEYKNTLENGDFSKGLWQEEVGDCNMIDEKGKLKMELKDQILKLSAANHIACTSTTMDVTPGSKYKVSLDGKADAKQTIKYLIGFGEDNLYFSQISNGKGWETLENEFVVPNNVNKINIVLYAESDDSGEYKDVSYKNINIVEIPNINTIFIQPTKKEILRKVDSNKPKVVAQKIHNTKYSINISTKNLNSFAFIFDQTFNPNWYLHKPDSNFLPNLSNQKNDTLNSFKMSELVNSWYIDQSEICNHQHDICRSNQYGGNDINFEIEFMPQRWFNLGSIISGTTLALLIGYLCYDVLKKRQNKNKPRKTTTSNYSKNVV
jgi:hypothetical protein